MKKVLFILLTSLIAVPAIGDERPIPVKKEKEKSLFMKDDAGGEKCFNENTHIINLGVGFGNPSYHSVYYGGKGYRYGQTPAFSFTYEQALPKKLGPGYLGLGAYLGFQHEYYEYDYNNSFNNPYYYHHSWNYYMVAVRGAYHWDVLNSKNAEVYAGVVLGMRFSVHNYSTNDPDNKDPYSYSQSFAYPAYSVFAGARWYFVKNFGLFAEAGYGISYINGGLSIKF